MANIVLFDLDNTLLSTEKLRELRERADYDSLTPEKLTEAVVYKPVHKILEQLQKQDVTLGIVTNAGRKYVEILLKHFNLYNYFAVIVTYSEVKHDGMKPSPIGIQMALDALNAKPNEDTILYVGDEHTDIIAAYRAGVTPIMPSWASRRPVSTAPSLEMSSDFLLNYFNDPKEYSLFGERCADEQTTDFKRELAHFLPLDTSGNVITVKSDMSVFCLGRYFSQKSASTASLHDKHSLSMDISKKLGANKFEIPDYWADMTSIVIAKGAEYILGESQDIDIVTIIPSKPGKDDRLERLLDMAKQKGRSRDSVEFIPDMFSFIEDAVSLKTLGREERSYEIRRSLHLNPKFTDSIAGKNILVIDDVLTTGATMSRAEELLKGAGAAYVAGLAIAKTVTFLEDEKSCPNCSRPMRLLKNSNTGDRFWGCSGFFSTEDKCTHTEPLVNKKCPKCNRGMRVRINGKTGDKFWGCAGHNLAPSCNYTEQMAD